MSERRIEVECYAGSRADERPRTVRIDGREHFIIRLLSSSVEESRGDRSQVRRFTVMTDEGRVLEIIHDDDGKWRLISEEESI